MKKLFLGLVFCGIFTFGAVSFFFFKSMNTPFSADHIIKVSKGEGFFKVLEKINSKEKISIPLAKLFLKLRGLEKALKPGEYEVTKGLSLQGLLMNMSKGHVLLYKVTIPEGYNLYEIGALLAEKNIIKSASVFTKQALTEKSYDELLKKPSIGLEGYLYPATYKLPKGQSVKDLLKIFVEAHQENIDSLLERYGKGAKLTRHELVTLASVVEKETGAPWERPLIASVFHNRLRKGMRLQSDPTTIYGQWRKTGSRLFNIRKRHLLEKNDYNTYTVKAIPIGPIANPGADAFEAVLNPKKSDYLYFVSKNDGTHYFSKSYKEHLGAVRKFQLSKKARKGKSWRNLKTKEL